MILYNLIILFLLSLATEAVTEILTSSELTEPIRKKWKEWAYPLDFPPSDDFKQQIKVWVDKLISCGYCSSVWVAAFLAIWSPKFDLGNWFINWLVVVLILHRLANVIHMVLELVKKGRVKTYDLEIVLKHSESKDGTTGQGIPAESNEAGPERSNETSDGSFG